MKKISYGLDRSGSLGLHPGDYVRVSSAYPIPAGAIGRLVRVNGLGTVTVDMGSAWPTGFAYVELPQIERVTDKIAIAAAKLVQGI